MKLLSRRGLLVKAERSSDLADRDADSPGARAGQQVFTAQGIMAHVVAPGVARQSL